MNRTDNPICPLSREKSIHDLLALPNEGFLAHQYVNGQYYANNHMEEQTDCNNDAGRQPRYQVTCLGKEIRLRPIFEKLRPFCQRHFQVSGDLAVLIHISGNPVHKVADLLWHRINHPIDAAV